MMHPDTNNAESVDQFRSRAREWLAENMGIAGNFGLHEHTNDQEAWKRARSLQQQLHEGGFAGICFPREYGGLGLTSAHQDAFNEEAAPYEMPALLNIPSFSICGATLLDIAGEELKKRHLPRIISGEEVWCQFLSEPQGGSDLAGVITSAARDGEDWVINGAKIWSTAAYAADFGLCLVRTDWSAPKHQGLTMFAMPIDHPGVTIQQIRLVDGSNEFCAAYFDDVRVPGSSVVGAVNDGWTTASRQLFHERNSLGGGSQYISGPAFVPTPQGTEPFGVATALGNLEDSRIRDAVGSAHTMQLVSASLIKHLGPAITAGAEQEHASSVLRLFEAERHWSQQDALIAVAGRAAIVGDGPRKGSTGAIGVGHLMRQANSLGGGSTEMARNIISERLLGMPREYAPDRGVPIRQTEVRHPVRAE